MKISLAQIPDGGLQLKETCPPENFDLDLKDFKFNNPVQIEAQVSRGINTITVEANLRAEAEAICSRCLESFTEKIDKKKRFDYSVEEQTDVDISEDIRQEIILGFPIKRLCKTDCKGLCSKCGKNLNSGPCNCQAKT